MPGRPDRDTLTLACVVGVVGLPGGRRVVGVEREDPRGAVLGLSGVGHDPVVDEALDTGAVADRSRVRVRREAAPGRGVLVREPREGDREIDGR